jgi:thiol-disulfide isomerase/thioredoxin
MISKSMTASRPVSQADRLAARIARRFTHLLTPFFILLASAFALPAAALEPDSAAPAFDLPGPNGPVKLSAYRGKLVYLDFWASWCAPCKRSFPWMNQIQARYGAQGLQVLAVNLDAKHQDAADFLAATSANFAIGFDPAGAVARSYGIKGMPSSILVGPDGRVLSMHAGFSDADKAELENLISANVRRVATQTLK